MEFVNIKPKRKCERCVYCGDFLQSEDEIKNDCHWQSYDCQMKKQNKVIEKVGGLYLRADRQKKRYFENKKK